MVRSHQFVAVAILALVMVLALLAVTGCPKKEETMPPIDAGGPP
ncbi:MAG TPA: methionine ABC transporter substrate-binding protein, partial [Armatimonadetes bacterium]|nr:methionine ABC transporter substrate-binding protein [Armatimonadota bacterium]